MTYVSEDYIKAYKMGKKRLSGKDDARARDPNTQSP